MGAAQHASPMRRWCLLSSLLFLHYLLLPVSARLGRLPPMKKAEEAESTLPFPAADLEEYDKGKWGIYPESKYNSTDIVGPHLLLKKWGPECRKEGQYFFVAPRGMLVGHPGPMLVDTDGEMVWHDESFPVTYGLTVQKYRGEDYITFWSGNDQVIGHGQGKYYMYDKHYNQYKMLDAFGTLTADLHDMKITHRHTMLITSYEALSADLSALGKDADGWIWDCYFQEIDIETNQLMFSWRATEHFTFDDCYNPVKHAGSASNPWDWFHINSVDIDLHGDYIISARYTHAITKISGKTGKIIWNIGGKHNDFKDMSNGSATDFAWQHDARWVDNYEAITVFDNAAYFGDQRHAARGLKLTVDQYQKKVRVVAELKHPGNYVTESQGSIQQLDNGNFLMGYGSASAWAEFTRQGEIVCDAEYGALHFHKNGAFSPGAVMSYRTYLHPWKGYPAADPKVKFKDGKVYLSWNGATELASWQLEGTSDWGFNVGDWESLAVIMRTGFESSYPLADPKRHKMYRLTARDKDENSLGMWLLYSSGAIKKFPIAHITYTHSFTLLLAGSILTLVGMAVYRRKTSISQNISAFTRRARRANSLNNWENVGVTPPIYHKYKLARNEDGLEHLGQLPDLQTNGHEA